MTKYDTTTYVETAKEKWGDRFDYSLIKYKNSYHKVSVRCIEHDELFEVDPISFIRNGRNTGNFCKKCKVNPKMTHDEYMEKIKKYEIRYDLSEVKFKTTRDSIKLTCLKHKHPFYIEARHLSSSGLQHHCPKCKAELSITQQSPHKIIEQSEEAVFYKILVQHKETKLKWMKIGITSLTTKQRYQRYNEFDIEILEEVFDTGVEVIKLEKQFKLENKHKRFYVPSYINFNGRTECYIIDDEIQLKANQVKFVRDALIEKQQGICPICGKDIKLPTLDHFHSKRHNGDGKVRGVLCNTCNRMIGVIENNAIKNNISFSDLPSFLRLCADYASKDHYPYIHPTEVKRKPRVSKRNYNQLKRIYNQKAKFPEYPASGKLTKRLGELFSEYNINPYN